MIHFNGIFYYKASSYGGTPMAMKTPVWRRSSAWWALSSGRHSSRPVWVSASMCGNASDSQDYVFRFLSQFHSKYFPYMRMRCKENVPVQKQATSFTCVVLVQKWVSTSCNIASSLTLCCFLLIKLGRQSGDFDQMLILVSHGSSWKAPAQGIV